VKINLTEEQAKLITAHTSGKITTPSGQEFYYVPYWFTKNEDGSWERLSIDSLPDDAKKQLEGLRNFIKKTCP